jgi:outer membrane protein
MKSGWWSGAPVVFVGLMWLPAPAQAQRRLTREEAEAVAVQTHPRLLAALARADAAKQVVREAQSAYFPFVVGSFTAVEAENNSRIAAGGLNNPIIFTRYANGVTLSQLITDFGRTDNLSAAAHLNADAARQDVESTRAGVVLRVDGAYLQMLKAQAVLRVAEETVKTRQLLADQVAALARSKLKSGLDVSFANVNLGEARLLATKARNEVSAAEANLSEALGLPAVESFDLVDEAAPDVPSPDAESLIEKAFRDRPDLAEQALSFQAATRFAKAERDLSRPTISAVGSAGLTPYRTGSLTSRYAAAGINMNVPIFTGRLYGARSTEAALRARAEEEKFLDLKDRVARDVRVAWLNASTAHEQLALTFQLLEDAQKALDLAQARYKLGLGSIVELSQAALNKTHAEIEQASSKYDYQEDLRILDYQTGAIR